MSSLSLSFLGKKEEKIACDDVRYMCVWGGGGEITF